MDTTERPHQFQQFIIIPITWVDLNSISTDLLHSLIVIFKLRLNSLSSLTRRRAPTSPSTWNLNEGRKTWLGLCLPGDCKQLTASGSKNMKTDAVIQSLSLCPRNFRIRGALSPWKFSYSPKEQVTLTWVLLVICLLIALVFKGAGSFFPPLGAGWLP